MKKGSIKILYASLVSFLTVSCGKEGLLLQFMEETKVPNFIEIARKYNETVWFIATINGAQYYIKDYNEVVFDLVENSVYEEISRESFDLQAEELTRKTHFRFVVNEGSNVKNLCITSNECFSIFFYQTHQFLDDEVSYSRHYQIDKESRDKIDNFFIEQIGIDI